MRHYTCLLAPERTDGRHDLPETDPANTAKPRTQRPRGADDLAILLPGGGARGAYQVGFLRWVSRNIPDAHFPIVTGVSAGAINAAFLASYRGTQTEAVDRLFDLWSNLTAERVFRTDGPSLGGLVVRWGLRLIAGGARLAPAVQGLVDTSPLRRTLADVFESRDGNIAGIAENIAEGRLWALALLTSHYGTGQSVVWTQGRDLREWERPDRRSRNTALTLDHVLASSALPLFFPAVHLTDGWHGDGGIRLTAPFSPARHLGANRILAVSTRPRCRSPGSFSMPSSSTTSTATRWSWNESTGCCAKWRPKSGAACGRSSSWSSARRWTSLALRPSTRRNCPALSATWSEGSDRGRSSRPTC